MKAIQTVGSCRQGHRQRVGRELRVRLCINPQRAGPARRGGAQWRALPERAHAACGARCVEAFVDRPVWRAPRSRLAPAARRLRLAPVYNGMAFTGGQTAEDCTLDIRGQPRQVLARIDRLLAEAGTSKSRLLNAQIWLKDIRQATRLSVLSVPMAAVSGFAVARNLQLPGFTPPLQSFCARFPMHPRLMCTGQLLRTGDFKCMQVA